MNSPKTAASSKLTSKHLFDMELEVPNLQDVGGPPGAQARVGIIRSGKFSGDRLSGFVQASGVDWQTLRSDGSILIDARIILRTQDEALIGMNYRGIRHGPAEVMDRLARGEDVDPAAYYFRMLCTFTTSDTRYGWLNSIVGAGVGRRLPSGPLYSVYEIT